MSFLQSRGNVTPWCIPGKHTKNYANAKLLKVLKPQEKKLCVKLKKKASVKELIKEYVLALLKSIMLSTIIAKNIKETSEIDKLTCNIPILISAIYKETCYERHVIIFAVRNENNFTF